IPNGNSITRIVFSSDFYFNWKQSPSAVRSALTSAIKTNKIIPRTITVSYTTNAYTGSGARYTFESAPLTLLMKQINDYSTNITSDILLERAGGFEKFQTYMKDTYGVDTKTVKFGTGSGLRNNYT